MQGIPVLGILGVWLVVTLALRLAVVLKVRGVGRQEMTERNYRSQRTPTVRRRQSGRERRMLVIALLCATLMGAALLALKESDFLRHPDTMLTPLRALFADQAEQSQTLSGVGTNPVFRAVKGRDVSALRRIADDLDDAWLNAVVAGMTPVIMAASLGDAQMLKELLSLGADPNRRGGLNRTALQYAAEKNRITAARVLLDAGADVDGADPSGLTPLIMAADRGYTELAVVLMDAGANVNARMNVGWTPLLDAARRGNLELTKILLQRGADIDATIKGKTAIDLARRHRHTNVVKHLESL